MHLTRKLIVTAALALALTGCSKNDEQAFSKVDYNKDGKIIFEELIVAFPDLTVEEFLAADADHSGGLDEAEYKRFVEARQAGKKLALPAKPQAAPADAAKAEAGPTTTASQVTPPQAPAAQAQNVPATTQVPAGQAQTAPLPANAPAANAPTANAVPMPQVAETPSSDHLGQAEEVETVVATTPAENKAPAQTSATTTYVVRRGDTLTRIAKKFGVTTKALMKANELKNADRVDAGATLTIPGTTAKAAPQAATTFVTEFFATGDAGDINALLDSYADQVDYYKKGKVGRDIVRQDKAEFFQRWPKRTYTPGRVTLVETTKQGELRVSVPVTFKAVSDNKTASGEAVFTFRLRPEGGSYKIVGETSAVDKRK